MNIPGVFKNAISLNNTYAQWETIDQVSILFKKYNYRHMKLVNNADFHNCNCNRNSLKGIHKSNNSVEDKLHQNNLKAK